MILNGSQQANLFKMLNTGLNISHPNISLPSGHLAGIISPSENDRRIDVSGDWILRGDTIFLQLKNYMKKTGKNYDELRHNIYTILSITERRR